jgi:RND superfamily putative drug exporter
MRSLARFCFSNRWLVLGAWVLMLVALFIIQSVGASEYRTDFELPGSESQDALDLLEERGATDRTGVSSQIVFKADQGVDDPAVQQRMEQFFDDVLGAAEGLSIQSPYEPGNEFQVAPDGQLAYAELNFSDRDEEAYADDAEAIKDIWREIDVEGLQVELGGDIFGEFEDPTEVYGLIAAVIILLIAFGTILAMALPIVTALCGVACGIFVIALFTNILAVPEFTPIVATLIGIGVGIDYALLIVTRHRAGVHDGLEPREAAALALDTSGRAVIFAGITVVISLLGLFMMNLDFMRSVALSAMAAVLFTMAASITLLPAFFGFIGDNIDRPNLRDMTGFPTRIWRPGVSPVKRLIALVVTVVFFWVFIISYIVLGARNLIGGKPGEPGMQYESRRAMERSFWYRWSRVIQRFPWPAMILSGALLIVMTIPVFSMRLGFSDAGNRPETDTTRRAYDLLSDGFGPGFNAPVTLLVDARGAESTDPAVLEGAAETVRQTPGVAAVGPQVMLGDSGLVLINVYPDSAPQDKETTDLVHRLRNNTVPHVVGETGVDIYVDGLPGAVVDFSDYTEERLPWFVGAVLLLSFVLLLTVFHSVIVPIKAVIMNLLSIGAAFGLTIAVFQWGFGDELVGLGKEGPIEAWGPMFIFAIVFGLSMDYEVFLLTRVREEYDRNGGDNGAAVADGLAATGRVISAAALIMVCVFGSFMVGDDRSIKMIGFALASAIFIDATVVRLILVPSAMELMGRANWWAPDWLVRFLPTIRVDAEPEASPAGGGGGGGS